MPGVHSKSLAGTYPVRGLLHLLHHPRRLGVPVAVSTAQACVVSLLALFPLFHFGYGWQTRLIGHFYKDWATRDGGLFLRLLHPSTAAALTSGLFCVAETFMVTSQVTHYCIGSLRERLFDATLEERHIVLPPKKEETEKRHKAETVEEWVVDKLDIEALPTTREEMTQAAQWWLSGSHIMGLCAKKESQVWPLSWLPTAIYVVSLPLTFIPVIGPASFLAMQGICQGGAAHRRYFDRFAWSNPRRIKHTTALYWHYLQFGMVASALEMIPFVGFVFAYTNQIGAAMLVADWKQERIM
ncbi:hypothetical protein [Absidia glauca]|uniref:Uncharacterized protein n=1 Tax=Absidia glauca TaxID=4829 RepID=A0A168MIB1_ABSGL|nr:hypothetical protein [Absidia glauca]